MIFGLRNTSALYATPTHCSPRPSPPSPGLDSVSLRLFIILNIALSPRESGVHEESIPVLCIVHQPIFCLRYPLGHLWQQHALHNILITLHSDILDENVMCIGQRQNSDIGARTRQIGIVSVMIRKTQEASKRERVCISKYGPMKLIQTYARVPCIWGLFGIARVSTRTS